MKSALIVRLPRLIEPGSETDAIVDLGDLLPTYIELAGGKVPENLDGKSLVSHFKNQDEEIKSELRKELLKWMEECGDKGHETELEAWEHMSGRN